MKGISYVSMRRGDDGAVSSADDEEQPVADAASDEDDENRSVNPAPQSPKTKATGTSSAIKKKREVVSFLHFCAFRTVLFEII